MPVNKQVQLTMHHDAQDASARAAIYQEQKQ
jgi:hypothetical protein